MQFLLLLSRYFFVILSITVVSTATSKADVVKFYRNLTWEERGGVSKDGLMFSNFVQLSNGGFNSPENWLPVYSETLRLGKSAKNIQVIITPLAFTSFSSNKPIQHQEQLTKLTQFGLQYFVGNEQGQSVVGIKFIPLQVNGNLISAVSRVEITVIYTPEVLTNRTLAKKSFASSSVLAQGNWYKLAVTKTGFQRIDRNYFQNIGINADQIDPRTIKIFGNGAGLLPQPNASNRPDDLQENAIWVNGESDGKFDQGDYVLFYGKAQFDVWQQSNSDIRRQKNLYSDTTYYFLTFGGNTGKRIQKQTTQPNAINFQNTHIYCFAHELDLTNVGRSGRQFLGEAFDRNPSQLFNFYIDGFIPTETIKIFSQTAAKSFISQARFDVSANGNFIFAHSGIPTVGTSYDSYYFSNSSLVTQSFTSAVPQVTLNYKYNSPPGGAIGWLDFFEINTTAQLTWYASQVLYRVLAPSNTGATEYTITGATASTRVFVVNNNADVEELQVNQVSNEAKFVYNTSSYTEFAGINSSTSYWVPSFAGKVANQNLHAMATVEAIYITPDVFYEAAARLANFHIQRGTQVSVVRLSQIYNEFSSGAQDITAIRDFLRMIYSRATTPAERLKYVTLFGRASYDYKYRISGNSNFVPTYESARSDNPNLSYCSDDFFGFLDDNEGRWETGSDVKEFLDIGIGRLPISNVVEANQAVDKIIGYHQSDRMADWRNKLVFVADDEDSNIHQADANMMANSILSRFPNYNVQKIWIDAYKQEVVAGGERYPTAQKAISDAVQKGCFIVNYTGHGGELGWASERILTIEDINSWTNQTKLPLIITATCEFSRFDDPARISAGELAFLNTKGGSIALFTTVRLVLAFSNTLLNTYLYNRLGLDSTSKSGPKPLGEIVRLAKNDFTQNTNERNFTLLGDAVMTLAYPKHQVVTKFINAKPVTDVTDTLKALSKVTISGEVTNWQNQVLTGYQGEVFITVYDKPTTYKTNVNDAASNPALEFEMQNNIIYSGSASVLNGTFTSSFIVPKDISYKIGRGKISYYVTDKQTDGNGFNTQFMVGGTTDSITEDKTGPELSLYMDDYKFVYGGLTNENPLFLAKISDNSGLNTTGTGIGRELTLIIDGDFSKAIPVNDYYKAKTNSYQEGEIRYPLKNLTPGKHTAMLKAWDTYNNSSEATTEFIVANQEELAIQQVLNYPNPFTTFTTFHFDHNKVGENLFVSIQVFTVSGKLVKTLSTQVTPANSHFEQLSWNGLDDFGDKLANGVYIYKVKVRSDNGKSAESTQKMVILN